MFGKEDRIWDCFVELEQIISLLLKSEWWIGFLNYVVSETGAVAGQNDKNNENSDPVYFCKTSCLSYL